MESINQKLREILTENLTKWMLFYNKEYSIEGVNDITDIPEKIC